MDQCLEQDYNIGKNLKKLRNNVGLTQATVAAKLQVKGLPISREIYAQIEGGRHHIKIRVLNKLKEIYQNNYEEMLEIEDKENVNSNDCRR